MVRVGINDDSFVSYFKSIESADVTCGSNLSCHQNDFTAV